MPPATDPLVGLAGAARPPARVLETLAHRPPVVPDPPGPTNIREDNPRRQGEIGFGDAVGWFARRRLTVSIPLADNQAYDLIVDVDGGLARVQVKTTTRASPSGSFVVQLDTRGGNQSFHTVKSFDRDACDVLYVLTDAGDRYVIPTEVVDARSSISVGARWARFRVPS